LFTFIQQHAHLKTRVNWIWLKLFFARTIIAT